MKFNDPKVELSITLFLSCCFVAVVVLHSIKSHQISDYMDFVSHNESLGRGVRHGCILSPSLFNLYAEYIMRRAVADLPGGLPVGGYNVNNFRLQTTLP